ncbi:MAG: sulfite exporter TauE/SafE family protein, partial [Rhodobacterales bacterium]|nr:sulfite exporter TauE/SafE family protein [Rhodobacterales bacterium]
GWGALRLTLGFVLGMVTAFVLLGLAAARLGMFFGTLGPAWTALGGVVIVVAGVALFLNRNAAALCPAGLQGWMESRFKGSGLWGAMALGGLTGTVLTPCATPVLGAALALAGSGGVMGGSALTGALMLLAYAIGRSPLLLLAGLAPQSLGTLARRLGLIEQFLPGQRAFSAVMVAAGLWLIFQSGILPQT